VSVYGIAAHAPLRARAGARGARRACDSVAGGKEMRDGGEGGSVLGGAGR